MLRTARRSIAADFDGEQLVLHDSASRRPSR